jgi:predicted transcriptional regulator
VIKLKKFYNLINDLKNQNKELDDEIKKRTSSENYLEAMSIQKEITELTSKNVYLKTTLKNLKIAMGEEVEDDAGRNKSKSK